MRTGHGKRIKYLIRLKKSKTQKALYRWNTQGFDDHFYQFLQPECLHGGDGMLRYCNLNSCVVDGQLGISLGSTVSLWFPVPRPPSLGLYSLSGKTSYRKISWSLEAARFGSKLLQSLLNLAGTSAALLPMCLSNFRAIRPLQHPISRLRDFTRFGGKTSYRLVTRGPG